MDLCSFGFVLSFRNKINSLKKRMEMYKSISMRFVFLLHVFDTFVFCSYELYNDSAFVYSISRIQEISRSKPAAHVCTSDSDALPLNRFPSSHFAPSAKASRLVALEPMSLLPEVQKGTIVLPLKS